MNKWSLCVAPLEVVSTVLENPIRLSQCSIVATLNTCYSPLSRFTSDPVDVIRPKQAPCPQEPQEEHRPW